MATTETTITDLYKRAYAINKKAKELKREAEEVEMQLREYETHIAHTNRIKIFNH